MALIINILIGIVCIVAISYVVLNLPKEIFKYPVYYLIYKYQMIIITSTFGCVVVLMYLGDYQMSLTDRCFGISALIMGIFFWTFLDKFKSYEVLRKEVDAIDEEIILNLKKTSSTNNFLELIFLFCITVVLNCMYYETISRIIK